MKILPRNDLPKKFPRCHYNSQKKSKIIFETPEQADLYIKHFNLKGYVPYLCRVCSKYHIGKAGS